MLVEEAEVKVDVDVLVVEDTDVDVVDGEVELDEVKSLVVIVVVGGDVVNEVIDVELEVDVWIGVVNLVVVVVSVVVIDDTAVVVDDEDVVVVGSNVTDTFRVNDTSSG